MTKTGMGLINTLGTHRYSGMSAQRGADDGAIPTLFGASHRRESLLTFSHEVRDTEPSFQDSLSEYRQSWSIKW